MIITSAYRHPAHNVAIGGSRYSAHIKGRAVDVLVSGKDALRLVRLALEQGMTGIGVAQRGPHDKRFIHLDDPVKNVKYGADYFKGLKKSFGNDRDALIAYNWGPGNYRKFLKNDYWIEKRRIFTVPGKAKKTIEIKHYKLPKETRDYVKKILGSDK